MNCGPQIYTFEEKLTSLINCYSKENESNTPDYILSQYIASCLEAFNNGVKRRDYYHNFNPRAKREVTP